MPVIEVLKSINIEKFYIGYENNSEWFMHNKAANECYFYDFYIPELQLIFEFNGEHVHPNKNKLSDEEWNKWRCAWTGVTADVAYEFDKRKEHTATDRSIDLYRIWRADGCNYNIDECKRIIQGKIC